MAKSSSSTFGMLTKVFIACFLLVSVGIQFVMKDAKLLHAIDKMLDAIQAKDDHLSRNKHLQGNYKPVADEHHAVAVEVVEGAIPQDLDGLFVRSGPNEIVSHLSKRYHLFDGHGMLHNLRIRNGQATYTNQFIPTPRLKYEQEKGESYFTRIGELVGWIGLFKAMFIFPNMAKAVGLDKLQAGPANTASIMFRNKFYCLNEANLPFEIAVNDDGTFQGVGYTTMENNMTLNYPFSAHGKKDPITGNLIFHGYTADPQLIRQDGPQKVGEISAATGEYLSYFSPNPSSNYATFAHDVAFTENWIMIFESSVRFAPENIIKGALFEWDDKHNLRIGLVPRGKDSSTKHAEKDVVWFDAGKAMSVVHILASWEEDDGTVVLWTPVSDYIDLNLENNDEYNFYMVEFRMHPQKGTIETKVIDKELRMEFPLVRDECYGRFCRYGYAGNIDDKLFTGIIKYDMEEKKVDAVMRYKEGEFGGEPVVIPKPGDGRESHDVYLGNFVHNAKENQSYFVLYDGDTALPVVKIRIPHRVPFGFHGRWVSGTDLNAHIAARQG